MDKPSQLAARAATFFRGLPEELTEGGPCEEYLMAVSELEEIYEILEHEDDPFEVEGYKQDATRAVRRARRNRGPCMRKIERAGTSLITKAAELPEIDFDS